MPQLWCECDSPDCEVDMQNGAGGYVIRGSDYRSNPAREGVCINERVCARRDQNGKETHITQMDQPVHPYGTAQVDPDKPCKTVFDDCVLDRYQCSDYYTMDDGCPLMPIGDPVGNRSVPALCINNEECRNMLTFAIFCSKSPGGNYGVHKGTVGSSRALRRR